MEPCPTYMPPPPPHPSPPQRQWYVLTSMFQLEELKWRKCRKPFFFHFKPRVLQYTMVATAISDESNEQHIEKTGMAHSCYKVLHPRSILFCADHFLPARYTSIRYIFRKSNWSTKYFVFYLYTCCLRINRNQLSVIKKCTILPLQFKTDPAMLIRVKGKGVYRYTQSSNHSV